MAVSYLPLGDVGVIYACTPAFTTLFAWAILREKCHVSDFPILFAVFLGVSFILRPPIIFKHIFPPEMLATTDDIPSNQRLIGTILALCGSFVQSGLFLALRKLRQVNYATISFYYAITSAPILFGVTGALGKIEMPPCYIDRLMAIGIAVSAQGGHIFMTRSFDKFIICFVSKKLL